MHAPGTFVDASTLLCEVPRCDSAACLGTVTLRASTTGETAVYARGSGGVNFTFYKEDEPPSIASVLPAATAGHGAVTDVRLAASNPRSSPWNAPQEQAMLCLGRNSTPSRPHRGR